MADSSKHLLLVEDEGPLRQAVAEQLTDRGFSVEQAESGEAALARLAEFAFDVIVTDLRLPGIDGSAVVEAAVGRYPDIIAIVVTGYGTVKDAVEAIKRGASDFVNKPFQIDELLHALDSALEQRRLKSENAYLRAQLQERYRFEGVVGKGRAMARVFHLLETVAPTNSTILITGETGTGKEVMAQYIHSHGPRAEKPFVGCNMTAIPETLVESELFGYVKGAFTGADRNKKGFIEAAEGGTLFLDEIGDLAPSIQLKLLRFLETRQYYRVGESTPKNSDVRIIAATNKELEEAIQGTGFRKDLYFRLNAARVILPSLRERREDIILLIANFIYQACGQFQRPLKKLSSSTKALFLEYPWPGNIRELKSVIESAVMVADSEYITISDLPMNLQHYATGHRDEIGSKAIRNIEEGERNVIEDALRQTNGNKAKAAEALGISTRTLYRKLEKFAVAN
jgi:DNA-binding NtrC family response regulator